MLVHQSIKPVPGDLPRQWIADDYFDLIVWYEPDGKIFGFQLGYDKARRERALTWTREAGFRHDVVDGGESKPTKNCTPILTAAGDFPAEEVLREFKTRSKYLFPKIRDLVVSRIEEYRTDQSVSRPNCR